MKFILVTGGVISGIGKGIVASSIGALLKGCNVRVTPIKIDPYINIDAGTFSPFEHGEVFVLNDGCEVDLDLGNYERFLDVDLRHTNNVTTGKIYQHVINKERQGDYLGKTVQVVPHVTDAIQEWIEKTASIDGNEVCVIELGGTIGDIEAMPFVEAFREMQLKNRHKLCICHVSHVPTIGPSDEPKSKPTQNSVSAMRQGGLHPTLIVCRSKVPVDEAFKEKISFSCGIEFDRVFSLPDLPSIYKCPTFLEQQNIIPTLCSFLDIEATPSATIQRWSQISEIAINAKEEVTIALVGKYTKLVDAYTSVIRSLEHACYHYGARPRIRFIESSKLEESDDNQAWRDLKTADCLLIPGAFGLRGLEGKIRAISWARSNRVPFLGICIGFQAAVIEYAREVCGLKTAHSSEFASELDDFAPVVIEMLEYKDPEEKKGGTMRLGLRDTKFVVDNSILKKLYGNVDSIKERHRHRYEINPEYVSLVEKDGLRFVGKNDDGTRMEVLELDPDEHPYFVGVQFHPEFLSRPFHPSPPYKGLISAARSAKE